MHRVQRVHTTGRFGQLFVISRFFFGMLLLALIIIPFLARESGRLHQ